jgi:hypothetical protein
MAKFVLLIKPPPATVQLQIQRDEIRKDLKPVANAHAKSRRAVVANWKKAHRPTFTGKVQAGPKRAGILVEIGGPEFAQQLWDWLDQTGTKPHKIRPKATNKHGRLFFRWGGPGSYQAKTGANPARYGGPGMVPAGSPLVAPVAVNHPGFEPRHFSEAINQDLEPKALDAIRTGGARGLRKAKRGG